MFDLLTAKKGDFFTHGEEIYLFDEANENGIFAQPCGLFIRNKWWRHSFCGSVLFKYDRVMKENFQPMSREEYQKLKNLFS